MTVQKPDHSDASNLGQPVPDDHGQSSMSPLCKQMLALVRELVTQASDTTTDLAIDLLSRNQKLSDDISTLRSSRERNEILRLLTTIVQQADSIYTTVDTSSRELQTLRQSLECMQNELVHTRQLLNEDALTGALNRRGLDQTMAQEIARAVRGRTALSLAMLDLDHFKKINDTHGHDVGDAMLVHFTGLVKSVMRASDALVRYGGEEFALLLPETDSRGAAFVVGRLQQLMSRTPLVMDGGKRVNTTFSAGVADLQNGETSDLLFRRADHALYAAKQAGRNAVKIAALSAPPPKNDTGRIKTMTAKASV